MDVNNRNINTTDYLSTEPNVGELIHDHEENGPRTTVYLVNWIYVSPIIYVLGLCGNILILCVIRRPKLRGSSAAVYLPLMAFFDILVLTTGMIPEWLEAMDIILIKETHPASCKLEKFIYYTSADTAVWLLVLFTFDRFFAVCFPLRKRDICTPKKAKIYFCATLLLTIIKNIHVFWTRGYEESYDHGTLHTSNCGKPAKYFESYIRPWIAFIIVSVIPFAAILTFNIAITRRLCASKKPIGHSPGPRKGPPPERQFSQATVMCLSVSFLFLVTITPSIVLLIGKPYWTKNDHEGSYNKIYEKAKAVSNVTCYLAHSLNFFLYCLTGKRFRKELLEMFTGCSPYYLFHQRSNKQRKNNNKLERSDSFASFYNAVPPLPLPGRLFAKASYRIRQLSNRSDAVRAECKYNPVTQPNYTSKV